MFATPIRKASWRSRKLLASCLTGCDESSCWCRISSQHWSECWREFSTSWRHFETFMMLPSMTSVRDAIFYIKKDFISSSPRDGVRQHSGVNYGSLFEEHLNRSISGQLLSDNKSRCLRPGVWTRPAVRTERHSWRKWELDRFWRMFRIVSHKMFTSNIFDNLYLRRNK